MAGAEMRVAMIGLRGIPAKSGGVEVVVENLAPLLVELGADVTVYCRTPYCDERPKEYKSVKLKYLPTINSKFTEAFVHSFLATMNAMFAGFDLIHYHAMGNGIWSIIPRIFGKKVIVTLHGLDYEREKWGIMVKTYLKICERIIARVPNKAISVSKTIAVMYKEKYGTDIEFIPNGVVVEEPRKLSKLKRFRVEKRKYVLFLSRIVPEKGLRELIKAWKQIDTKHKLLVVGDATHTDAYMKEVKDLAFDDDRIIFAGPLYGEDKAEAYSNARFMVLPSTIEGMPIVLLEAMSYGLCTLVSNIPENLDVIGDSGFAFRVRDTEHLRQQLNHMLKHDSEVRKLGAASKKMVAKNYDWKEVAKQTYGAYKL